MEQRNPFPVCVRLARDSDYDALRPLWRQLDLLHADLHPQYFCRPDEHGHRSRAMLRRVLVSVNRCMLVATDEDDRPIGAVQVQIYETPDETLMVRARRGHVEDLIVDAKYRRCGVGRRLMDEAALWCRRRGARQLVLTVWSGNDEAEEFYERLGYRTLNRVLSLPLE